MNCIQCGEDAEELMDRIEQLESELLDIKKVIAEALDAAEDAENAIGNIKYGLKGL